MKSSASNTLSLRFPKSNKYSKETSVSTAVLLVLPLTKDEIRQIVSSAYNDALRRLDKVGVCDSLNKNKMNTFKRLNPTSATVSQFRSASSSFDAESGSESDDETHDGGPYDDELNVKSVHGVRIVDRVNSESASCYFKSCKSLMTKTRRMWIQRIVFVLIFILFVCYCRLVDIFVYE